jgi:hypothetical protein
MRYELWHIQSANLMDDFDDEGEAVAAARVYLTPDEAGETVDVALLVYDKAGQMRSLHGTELAAMVFGSPPTGVRQSA